MRPSRFLPFASCLFLLLSPSAAGAQERTEVTVPFSVRTAGGEITAQIGTGDLDALIGGEPAPLVAVDPAAQRRVVIYLDQVLSTGSSLQRAAGLLGATAGSLTQLGEVEIVSADPLPKSLLPPTTDPAAMDAALSQIALSGAEQGTLRTLRERLFQRLLHLRGRPAAAGPQQQGREREIVDLVNEAVAAEEELLQRQQDALLSWLASTPADGRHRILILVSDGFDLEPRSFYLRQLPEATAETVRATAPPSRLTAAVTELSRALAGLGWTVVALAPAAEEAEDASRLEYDRFKESAGTSDRPAAAPMFSTTLERLRRRLREGEEEGTAPRGPLLSEPRAPLELLAAATGGAVVSGGQDLGSTIGGLRSFGLLRLQAPAEGLNALALRGRRPGLEVRAPAWLSASPPEAVAAARARRILAGEPTDGPSGAIDVSAALLFAGSSPETEEPEETDETDETDEPDQARLEARIQLPAEAGGRLRVTVAPGSRDGPASLEHLYEGPRAGPWNLERPVRLADSSDRVAVLVEDLATGAWGGTLAATLEGVDDGTADPLGDDEIASALAEARFLPRPKAVRLLAPEGELLRGRVRFQTLVDTEKVARVVFLLDGKEVDSRDRPPFNARVQLGELPRPHTLQAVGYDAAGREVGRDVLEVNDVGGGFRVSILTPEPGPATGPVDVLADVDVPADQRLDRVDFSWNERRLATLYSPPFRHRLYVPAGNPGGFIRVVAHLDDGRTAEDVVFLNEEDFAERLSVRLVELYTVVTDKDGRPVRGLKPEQFIVREEGEVQEIAEFNDAGDLPITLGLNIDSSASMFVKLPAVQQAAGDFVRGFLSGRDQAFLVDFDTEPRLAQPVTSDLRRVVDAVESLRPGGDTHIWESIVYSLVELQSVPGKKAVIVFSDGAQEEEALEYRVCFEFARRLGVPVYLIVLHPGIARGDDLTSATKGFTRKLDRLAEATGGQVFYLPNTDGLDAIYRQIDTELRSQYLLAYYAQPSPEETPESWRRVEVKVTEKDLRARTIEGYFPRL